MGHPLVRLLWRAAAELRHLLWAVRHPKRWVAEERRTEAKRLRALAPVLLARADALERLADEGRW